MREKYSCFEKFFIGYLNSRFYKSSWLEMERDLHVNPRGFMSGLISVMKSADTEKENEVNFFST